MGAIVTTEKIREMILAGRGQGHGKDYRPWLQLGPGQFIPKSLHGWYINPLSGAQQDIFSDIERRGGIVGRWLGAIDDRPQFPCFPFRHPHPSEDAPGREKSPLPWAKGTLALANDANLRHPIYVGTNINYVLTFDVLFTLPPVTRPRLAALAGKDKSVTRSNDPGRNVVTNIEIARRYAVDIGASFCTWDQLVCPSELIKNLVSIYSSASLPPTLACSAHYPAFLKFAMERVETVPVRRILQQFAETANLPVMQTTFLWDHAAWTQQIKIDLTKPDLRAQPAPLWDGEWMKDMRHAMFGIREF